MNQSLKLLFFLGLLCNVYVNIWAQDVMFSQFYAAPLHLNPALAGISYGPRANLIYRNQWPSIDNGFVTYYGSYDQHFDQIKGGVGINFNADQIFGGTVKNFSMQATYSYQLALSRKFAVKLALSGGFFSKRLAWDKLLFQDQINPVFGFTDASGIPNPTAENINQNNSVIKPDFGAGILAFTPNFFAGVGMKHLNQPSEKFNTGDVELPLLITLHGGYVFDLAPKKRGKDIFVSPNVLLALQNNFSQMNIGAFFNYEFFSTGLFYRHAFENSDAVIASVGFTIEYVKIGYSFDVPMSDLSTNNSGGAHEITFTFNWGGNNNSISPNGKSQHMDCPRMLKY